jgi:DNA-binding GntR family transcriptional regulator
MTANERRPIKLYTSAYNALAQAILAGAYRPGQKITIRGVSSTLGFSVTPVREALRQLAAKQALEWEPNRSLRLPVLSPERLEELWVIRSSLEGVAAEAAARHLDEVELGELEQIELRRVEARDRGDVERQIGLNAQFHFTLYRASGWPHLVNIVEGLWLSVGPLLRLLAEQPQLTRDSPNHHTDVLRALRARDGQRARAAIEADIATSRPAILAALSLEAAGIRPVRASKTSA